MAHAKVQHYVPQFLLRNFGTGKRCTLFGFNKATGKRFPTNPHGACGEGRFYDFEIGGQKFSIDPHLGRLETDAADLIASILRKDSVADLSSSERALLAKFFSVQHTRTRAYREDWKALPEFLREHFRRTGTEVEHGSETHRLLKDISENEAKQETSLLIAEASNYCSPFFLERQWFLAATTISDPFVIGDNPLTRQNLFDGSECGNGFNRQGTEIYLPLSPTRALGMWHPALIQKLRKETAVRECLALDGVGGGIDADGLALFSQALVNGQPVRYLRKYLQNLNALQVAFSEKFVYSSFDDFTLAIEIIEMHPDVKHGPRTLGAPGL